MSDLPARFHASTSPAPATVGKNYLSGAFAHPSGVTALMVGLCMGAWLGGLVGAFIGLLSGLALVAGSSRLAAVRRLIDGYRAERQRRRRTAARERRLALAGPVRRAEFAELTARVDEIERDHAAEVDRFDLQELLDCYVDLAVSHQRLIEAVQRADRAPLWEAATSPGRAEAGAASRQRRQILARRLRHRDECRTRAQERAEELDAIAEFIQLVGELTTCPSVDGAAPQEIERRLWELEAQESALRQLSAA
jgi:hypothetical protein